MVKNKLKNGCGCSLFWMYKWLPDLRFKQACNIHDIAIKETFWKSTFDFLSDMKFAVEYSIDLNIIQRDLLYIIAHIYFLGVLCFGWIFHILSKIQQYMSKK